MLDWDGSADNAQRYQDYDERDVRVRPNPKANRPRTKQRPDYSSRPLGMVTGVDRGRYRIDLDGLPLIAARARELRNTAIVVGDNVRLTGDLSGSVGALARIAKIDQRKTVLRRSADDLDQVERIIVANADVMVMVVAAQNPPPRPRLIERYVVAAEAAGIHPILVITKTDLAAPDELIERMRPAEIETFAVAEGSDTSKLRARLMGHTSVLVGHSGVGKSTLINALIPGADRATGHVNTVTGRGRHTSSSASAVALTDGNTDHDQAPAGWIIDTPGVRSFGLGHISNEEIISAFTDLTPLVAECPRGCAHTPGTLDCMLDEALQDPETAQVRRERIISLQMLLQHATDDDRRS